MFSIPVVAYIATVVLVNVGFSYVPLIETPIGMLSPMATIVGIVFVLRDFAQRQAGHGVLLAMVVATVLSYALADPYVATASAIAFALSEIADYLVYSFAKRPFRERILISSIISSPIDTAVFLLGINAFTIGTFILMTLSKLTAAIIVWYAYKTERFKERPVTADGADYPTFI